MAKKTTVRKVKVKLSRTLPTVLRSTTKASGDFPVEHYSYSSFVKFSTNPFLFKVNYINGDVIDTTTSPSAVLGKAVHKAVQAYIEGDGVTENEGDKISIGLDKGMEYLKNYPEEFIGYNTTIDNREKLNKKFAFAYLEYIKSFTGLDIQKVLLVEKTLKYKVQIDGKDLPVPLKGIPDLVYEDSQGRIRILDHKITGAFSKETDIDGSKLLQAAFLYFLVYAEFGRPPYAIAYRECKHTENREAGKDQVQEYEIIYEKMPEIFELFYRMYDDVTNALLGKQVFIPNLNDLFDKEISILSYIHRLDVDEERAKALKAAKVDNITQFLQKKIQNESSLKKFMETVNKRFISGSTLNYKDMTPQDKIRRKMAEHGFALDFDSVVEGYSVDLYCFEPSVGLKMTKLEGYVKDVEQVLGTTGVRVLAPIPNSSLVGYEVPRQDRRFPQGAPEFNGLELAIGVDTFGKVKHFDIREAPHMLVAGATGSGKSVFLSTLIKQLAAVPNADLYLFDPKMVELAEFADQAKVYESDNNKIAKHLHDLTKVMNVRYKAMQKAKVRNIKDLPGYNYIFAIIDEYGDLIASNNESTVRNSILILAQKARAAGIHIILTTQRPSVKIVDGDIKANFPTRVSFRTSTSIDSQVVLDEAGAETLLGKGDMLFKTNDGVIRLQGFQF